MSNLQLLVSITINFHCYSFPSVCLIFLLFLVFCFLRDDVWCLWIHGAFPHCRLFFADSLHDPDLEFIRGERSHLPLLLLIFIRVTENKRMYCLTLMLLVANLVRDGLQNFSHFSPIDESNLSMERVNPLAINPSKAEATFVKNPKNAKIFESHL